MQNGDFESRFRANSLFHVRHTASRPVRACGERFTPIRVLVNCRSAPLLEGFRMFQSFLEGSKGFGSVSTTLEEFGSLLERKACLAQVCVAGLRGKLMHQDSIVPCMRYGPCAMSGCWTKQVYILARTWRVLRTT